MTLSFSFEDLESQNKSPLDLSPYEKFMYALNSKESKRQYPKRLQTFLDFIGIKSKSIEENCNLFYKIIEEKESGITWLENELFRFFAHQNKRVDKGEISTETIKKLFQTC